ncbi:MAG: aminoacyl-tRNA hydrolase [Bryobacteraceae bacterium]|nr:aminoacyl-tRNA hydrolase [Bryobacteraceae bacterium]
MATRIVAGGAYDICMDDLPINQKVTIPGEEVRIAFARSGGPGGQNVNKVESKVELRWTPASSAALDEADRRWLLGRLQGKLTAGGDLVVTSNRTRDQIRNRMDALAKLAAIVEAALDRPTPRRKTRPTRASVEDRLREKRRRSDVKKRRPAVSDVDI